MALNGSFPEELDRTKPYGYSLFNLDAITALAWTLTDQNNDMWNYTLDDGRGIKKGLDFMLPYLKDKSAWPYGKDISHWEKLPDARQFMLYAAIMETNREWFTLWNSLQEENHAGENRQAPSIKNPLLWMAN